MTTNHTQRVLITAGAGGIGRAIATAFAAAGARVHVCDIDASALSALKEQTPSIGTSVCDVADRESVRRMFDDALATLGGLDVLVNNAGISGPTASVEDMEPAAWDSVLRVNLTGTFTVTQAAIPHLKRSAAGSIIVMSSLAGGCGHSHSSPVSTTKWGPNPLHKTLHTPGRFGFYRNAELAELGWGGFFEANQSPLVRRVGPAFGIAKTPRQ